MYQQPLRCLGVRSSPSFQEESLTWYASNGQAFQYSYWNSSYLCLIFCHPFSVEYSHALQYHTSRCNINISPLLTESSDHQKYWNGALEEALFSNSSLGKRADHWYFLIHLGPTLQQICPCSGKKVLRKGRQMVKTIGISRFGSLPNCSDRFFE